MSAPEPSEERKLAWGNQTATLFCSLPHLQKIAHLGISTDPTHLISSLEEDNDLSGPLDNLFLSIEAALTHHATEYEILRDQHNTLQRDYNRMSCAMVGAMSNAAISPARRVTTDPDPFTGEEKDVVKRQQNYLTLKANLLRCFAVDSHTFTTEFLRIQYIAARLKGEAAYLYRERFETVTRNPTEDFSWHWKTSDAVFQTLDEQYATVDLSRQAAIDFDNLWMRNQSFQNFKADFDRLAQLCKKTNVQKVEALKIRVSQELSDRVFNIISTPGPDDFEAWCKLFNSIYQNEQEKAHLDRLRSSNNNRNRQFIPASTYSVSVPAATVTTTTASDTGDPMILDATHRIALDTCAYCKEKGHWKNDCQKRKSAMALYSHPPGSQQQGRGRYVSNHGQSSYARGGFGGRGRGRGQNPSEQYQNQYQNHYQQPTPQHRPQPLQYQSQLRAIEHGYVGTESESSSPIPNMTPDTLSVTPSLSASNSNLSGNV